MAALIIALVIGFIVAGIMKLVIGPIRKSMTGRDARLDDSLTEFGGSHGADRALGPESEEGVARMYERMCVTEPSRWVGDTRIPGVIKRYRDIVTGREADPEGHNVPSSHLFGRPNPDYLKYLQNQRKHVGSAWASAVKAARKSVKEQTIRDGFDAALRKMGMPEALIPFAITDDRLDSYTPAQWNAIVKAMRSVCDKYSERLAIDMLSHFSDPDVLCSEESAETFDALCKQDIPFSVSKAVVLGQMTMEQAQRAVELVEEWDYGWDEAVVEVVSKDDSEKTDAALRAMYARKVNPRAKSRG
jgi:hypothetical protein